MHTHAYTYTHARTHMPDSAYYDRMLQMLRAVIMLEKSHMDRADSFLHPGPYSVIGWETPVVNRRAGPGVVSQLCSNCNLPAAGSWRRSEGSASLSPG